METLSGRSKVTLTLEGTFKCLRCDALTFIFDIEEQIKLELSGRGAPSAFEKIYKR